jgi:hypothetical protein
VSCLKLASHERKNRPAPDRRAHFKFSPPWLIWRRLMATLVEILVSLSQVSILIRMPPARFELTAPGLGILCSILLSYGGVYDYQIVTVICFSLRVKLCEFMPNNLPFRLTQTQRLPSRWPLLIQLLSQKHGTTDQKITHPSGSVRVNSSDRTMTMIIKSRMATIPQQFPDASHLLKSFSGTSN